MPKKEYSTDFAARLLAHMDGEGYRYSFDEDTGILRMNFNVKCRFSALHFIFDIKEWGYICYGCIDMKADEENRRDVAEFLTRANYGLMHGNFELDMNDGEIRYKFTADCDGTTLSEQIIEDSMNVPLAMFARYGNALLNVMMGIESAEDAIKRAEG